RKSNESFVFVDRYATPDIAPTSPDRLDPTALPRQLKHQVQGRDEEEVQRSRQNHPPEDGRAHGMPAGLAGAAGEDERDDPEAEGERGHEDRPEAQARRLHRRVHDGEPALP